MAKSKTERKSEFLRWSDHVPASEVTDPLGLGLRGSTRIAGLLLYCITSITPRARYFSFIPWCISDFQSREMGAPHALGMKEAIAIRQNAHTLACILHHEGDGCAGPGLIGVREGKKWFAQQQATATLKTVKLTRNSVLTAYYTSLVNLGFFESEQERQESEQEIDDSTVTFDSIALSELGLALANAYGSVVGPLGDVKAISEIDRTCAISGLKEFGKRGGLCELADPSSPDRDLLRDVFFARKGFTEKSHFRRSRSLLLILELCRQFSAANLPTDSSSFSSAIYYGQLVDKKGDTVNISLPSPLVDIATRWKMFYFHHFMSVALEGMFSWLVTQLLERGIAGATLPSLVDQLNSPLVTRSLSELLTTQLSPDFGFTSPADFFGRFGVRSSGLDDELSHQIDATITANHVVAEQRLESIIRDRKYLRSSTGLALSAILFALTLGRYRHWEFNEYGNWLTSDAVVKNPYLDILPSTASLALLRHQGDWWNGSWTKLTEYSLSRFVVQQHQSMSYEKTSLGDRCLLQVDGNKVMAEAPFEKIGLGNPRLDSAIQVLSDLALTSTDDEGITFLTPEGRALLRQELERGGEV